MTILITNKNIGSLETFNYTKDRKVTANKIRIPYHYRGRSRAAATSDMERFVIIVNGLKPLTIIKKRFILSVAAALDPSLITFEYFFCKQTLGHLTALVSNKSIVNYSPICPLITCFLTGH